VADFTTPPGGIVHGGVNHTGAVYTKKCVDWKWPISL
jgi:hypothetical protein